MPWPARADDLPLTRLNGTLQFGVAAQLRPDSTTHISEATFDANLHQVAAEGMPAFQLAGVGALDERRLRIDSAAVLLGGIAVDLKGALARDSMAVDTLVASLQVDSLAAARPELIRLADMIFPLDSAISKSIRSYASDTLDGDVSGSAVMVGALPAFSANVSLSARQMQVGIIDVRRVFGSVRATGSPITRTSMRLRRSMTSRASARSSLQLRSSASRTPARKGASCDSILLRGTRRRFVFAATLRASIPC